MWDAVIPAAISAVGSLFGGESSNAANAKLAREQMAFQAAQMDKQMAYNTNMVAGANAQNWDMFNWNKDFAVDQFRTGMDFNRQSRDMSYDFAKDVMAYNTEMSNTAYQRATRDMRAAGLNPILAYSQGGASSPTGVMPTSPGAMAVGGAHGSTAPIPGVSPGAGARAEMRDVITPALATALQGARAIQSVDLLGAQVESTRAEAAQRREAAIQTRALTALQTAQAVTENRRPSLLNSEIQRNIQGSNLLERQWQTEAERPGLLRSQAHAHSAQAEATRQGIGITERWGRSSNLGNLGETTESVIRRLRDVIQDIR